MNVPTALHQGLQPLLSGLLMALGGLLVNLPAVSQAAPWKACSYNDQPIPCRDGHSSEGSVRILWQDGLSMTYRLVEPGFPLSTLRDAFGGLWQREVLVQGNAVFTNKANGNRIVVPLR